MSEPNVPILNLPAVTSVSSAAWVPIVQGGVTSRVQMSTLLPLGFETLPLAVASGGTGATTAAQARINLGLGTAAVQNIGTSGATVPLLSTVNTWATTQTFTVPPVFTDQAGTRSALGLGTAAVQNIGTSGATVPLLSTANTWALAQTLTTAPVFTDQSGTRTALGLGTAATQNTGTSGATLPFLDGVNTWSGTQTFGSISLTGTIAQVTSTTQASGSYTNTSLYLAAQPSGASTATYNGLSIPVQFSSASDTSGAVTAGRFAAELFSTGGANQVQGVYGLAIASGNTGTYTSGSLYGGRFQAQLNGTRNFNHVIGIKIDGPQISQATATAVFGLYIQAMASNISGSGAATASTALFFEGSGIANGMAWGNGGSGINANLYSQSANALTLNASSGLTLNSFISLVGGTLTASTPGIDATQTWNNAGVSFTGWKLNVTNTASASSSLLLDLQTGGSSLFNVRRDGSCFTSNFIASSNLRSRSDSGNVTVGASDDTTLSRRSAGVWQTNSAQMIGTTVSFTNGSAAATGTLNNAPTAGNPTKWIPINDNGTTRYLPAW